MVVGEDIHPFVATVACCLAVVIFAPLLLTDSLVSALTATPLRRAASTFVVLAVGGTVSLWVVSRVSLRTASAIEGTQGGGR